MLINLWKNNQNSIFYILLLPFLVNLICSVIGWITKKDSFVDLAYGISFIASNLFLFFKNKPLSFLQLVIFFANILWAFRLTFYLLIRSIKMKRDKRFDVFRRAFFKWLSFFLLQTVSIYLINLPVSLCLLIEKNCFLPNFNWIAVVGFILFLVFLIFETIADYQKINFYAKKKKSKPFIDYGLWKISRHPNYFAEIVIWWTLTITFLACYFLSQNFSFSLLILTLISPIFLTLLLVYFSGIPILEKKAKKKLANNRDYQKYLQKTLCLIPWIGKKYY